ncbi:MAG: aminotransferase [Chloroflexia bacterium]|jgi:aspartate/methionine/tyrosine aminotransferase|nr:aminotransferase [Chloroflexia bacterium]
MVAATHPPDPDPDDRTNEPKAWLVNSLYKHRLDALGTPAFILKNQLHLIGKEAEGRGDIAKTISMARGDPNYSSPALAQSVFAALSGRAQLISELGIEAGAKAFETLWALNDPTITGGRKGNNGDIVFQTTKRLIGDMVQIGKEFGLSDEEVEYALYKQILGEQYDDPKGLLMVRAILAQYLNDEVFGLTGQAQVAANGIIITEGAGSAIGAFVAMCYGTGYLQPGDKVVLLSPLYEPYAVICANNGLDVLPLDCSGLTGQPSNAGRAWLENQSFKLMIIVDPSNPTGNTLNNASISWLASLAERNEAVVLVDAVYTELLDEPTRRNTIMQALPAQSVIVWSFSKSHCQTGGRIGGIAYSETAAAWLRQRLNINEEIDEAFCTAKCLAGAALKHVSMLPTPQQIRAAVLARCSGAHLSRWRAELQARYTLMHEELGLTVPQGVGWSVVPYYITFSLEDLIAKWASNEKSYMPLLISMRTGLITHDELLVQLAKNGVELLYCARFFPGAEYEHRWFVRISVANQHQPVLREVARMMRKAFMQMSNMVAEEQANQ